MLVDFVTIASYIYNHCRAAGFLRILAFQFGGLP